MKHYRDYDEKMATGYYAYQNHDSGMCEYRTKATAIRNAQRSHWERHETPQVYSPTGKVVWRG